MKLKSIPGFLLMIVAAMIAYAIIRSLCHEVATIAGLYGGFTFLVGILYGIEGDTRGKRTQ